MQSMIRIRKRSANGIRQSWDNRLFDALANTFLILLTIVTIYPLWFILVASFTDYKLINAGSLLLYPKGFHLMGYEKVFADWRIWSGYMNTLIYTVGGTAFGAIVTILAGYAFSRKDLPGSGILMKLFIFTMYFGGGLIPTYIMIKNLGLLDTRLLMILQSSISVHNIIVVRSFMKTNIPDELLDAATIDGCGNGTFFVSIVMPLSKAIFAVMVLYIAVSHWNSYFNALIYLTDRYKYPLQVFLREILLQTTQNHEIMEDAEMALQVQQMTATIRYSVIVVSTAPILCVYPFIQKYFVKGVMIGSVKG